MIAITLDTSGAETRLAEIQSLARNPRAIMAAGGRAVRNTLVAHFRNKDRTEPNKLGGKRTRFWLQVARSVQNPEATESRAVVSINHPAIAQKIYGGPIVAKRTRNLAIPVEPKAYGRAPATFEKETGLQLVFVKQRTNAFLAAVIAPGRLQVEYVLTPRVNQDPDPTALPPQADLLGAFLETAEDALQRQLKP